MHKLRMFTGWILDKKNDASVADAYAQWRGKLSTGLSMLQKSNAFLYTGYQYIKIPISYKRKSIFVTHTPVLFECDG